MLAAQSGGNQAVAFNTGRGEPQSPASPTRAAEEAVLDKLAGSHTPNGLIAKLSTETSQKSHVACRARLGFSPLTWIPVRMLPNIVFCGPSCKRYSPIPVRRFFRSWRACFGPHADRLICKAAATKE